MTTTHRVLGPLGRYIQGSGGRSSRRAVTPSPLATSGSAGRHELARCGCAGTVRDHPDAAGGAVIGDARPQAAYGPAQRAALRVWRLAGPGGDAAAPFWARPVRSLATSLAGRFEEGARRWSTAGGSVSSARVHAGRELDELADSRPAYRRAASDSPDPGARGWLRVLVHDVCPWQARGLWSTGLRSTPTRGWCGLYGIRCDYPSLMSGRRPPFPGRHRCSPTGTGGATLYRRALPAPALPTAATPAAGWASALSYRRPPRVRPHFHGRKGPRHDQVAGGGRDQRLDLVLIAVRAFALAAIATHWPRLCRDHGPRSSSPASRPIARRLHAHPRLQQTRKVRLGPPDAPYLATTTPLREGPVLREPGAANYRLAFATICRARSCVEDQGPHATGSLAAERASESARLGPLSAVKAPARSRIFYEPAGLGAALGAAARPPPGEPFAGLLARPDRLPRSSGNQAACRPSRPRPTRCGRGFPY